MVRARARPTTRRPGRRLRIGIPAQYPLTDSVTTTEQTQVVEPGSGNITRDAQSLTAQFIAANNADNSPRRVEPTA